MMSQRRGGVLLVAALAVSVGAVACSPPREGEALFEKARQDNLTFKATIAQLQSRIWSEGWDARPYGDFPGPCDVGEDGFAFRMSRSMPAGTLIPWPDGVVAAGDVIADWMSQHGWADIRVTPLGDPVSDVNIRASHPDGGVADLDLQMIVPMSTTNEGAVRVSATSVCFTGDLDRLYLLLYPTYPDTDPNRYATPDRELPDATPIFGFDADGTPRTSGG